MAASINFVTVSSTLTFWNVSTIFKGCRAPQAVCCIRKFTGNGIPVKPGKLAALQFTSIVVGNTLLPNLMSKTK